MSAHIARLPASPWRWVFLLLLAGGLIASLQTFFYGIGSTTHLSDLLPWGLCLGLNVFCGIALACGALTVAAVTFVADRKDWLSLRRASLVAGLSGYVVAMLGVVANQGLGERAWWTIFRGWTSRSILSGAVWTLGLLGGIFLIEFLPDWFSPALSSRWFVKLQRLGMYLAILAAMVAMVHQYGLNRLMDLAGGRFSPLWAGSRQPMMFYLSAIAGALAVLLFASWRSRLAFGRSIPSALLGQIARALSIAVFVYLGLRLMELIQSKAVPAVSYFSRDGSLMVLEITLLFCGMALVHEPEADTKSAPLGPVLIMAGVLANRLNNSITALESSAGAHYWPSWNEVLIAYSLVAVGIALFVLGVKHLLVFSVEVQPSEEETWASAGAGEESLWN